MKWPRKRWESRESFHAQSLGLTATSHRPERESIRDRFSRPADPRCRAGTYVRTYILLLNSMHATRDHTTIINTAPLIILVLVCICNYACDFFSLIFWGFFGVSFLTSDCVPATWYCGRYRDFPFSFRLCNVCTSRVRKSRLFITLHRQISRGKTLDGWGR